MLTKTLIQLGSLLKDTTQGDERYMYNEHVSKFKPKKGDKDVVVYDIDVNVKDNNVSFSIPKILSAKDPQDYIGSTKQAYFYNFRTSSADKFFRYIFGDINFAFIKKSDFERIIQGIIIDKYKIDQNGVYTPKRSNKEYLDITFPIIIGNFLAEFIKHKDFFAQFIGTKTFIHFNFIDENGNIKEWYQFDQIMDFAEDMFTHFYTKQVNGGFVLTKSLLPFSNMENLQIPDFSEENMYKVSLFTKDEIKSLIYSSFLIDMNRTIAPKKWFGKNYGAIFLPSGEYLTRSSLISYLNKPIISNIEKGVADVIEAENDLSEKNDDINVFLNDDYAFNNIVENSLPNIIDMKELKFDIVFQKLDRINDVILVLSQIRESRLKMEYNKIESAKKRTLEENKIKYYLDFYKDLSCFFSTKSKTNPYEKYLVHCMYKLYSGKYTNNERLLKQHIEKVTSAVRVKEDGSTSDFMEASPRIFMYSMYFEFLVNVESKNKLNDMKENINYQLGFAVGEFSQCRKATKNNLNTYRPNLFNYVNDFYSRIQRRSATIDGVMDFVILVDSTCRRNDYPSDGMKLQEITNMIDTVINYEVNYFALGFINGLRSFKKQDKIVVDQS